MKRLWLWIAFAAAALTPAGAGAGITETRTPHGSFDLIEEVSRLEPGEPAIMHVSQNWTKLHLAFATADKATKVAVVDNGGTLEIAVEAAGCLSRSYPFGYGEDGGKKLYRNLEKSVEALYRLCPRLSSEQKLKHRAELKQARLEFPGALEAMKARASAVFGGWRRRCIKYDMRQPPELFRGPECTRFSARSN